MVEVMDADKETAWLFSRLLYEPHIYNALSDEYKDVYMAHELLQEIEFGYRIVIGAFDDKNNFVGCVHGILQNGIYTCHILFRRKVNVLPFLLECENKFKEYCVQKDMQFNCIDGYIAPSNTAACRIAHRFGAVCMGCDFNVALRHKNIQEPCLHFRKEIN